jgi:two-component system OmpR family sensor kinase
MSGDRSDLDRVLDQLRGLTETREGNDNPIDRTVLRTLVDDLDVALRGTIHAEAQAQRFLADTSHEMRIPLTVIRGEAELLLRRDDGSDEERCTALAAIDEEASRLGRLLDDLLTLNYRPERLHLRLEPVDIASTLRVFVERYADAWPQRALQLNYTLPPSALAIADRDALTRVLINLVENAARYSRPGGAITLAVHPEGDRIAIEVSDEGPGMAPDEVARVFERFYRGAAGRGHDRRGSGLGLSIVRTLVEAMNGTVHLDSAPTRGTTVTLLLPTSSMRTRSQP